MVFDEHHRLAGYAAHLLALGRRSRQVLLLAAVTGVVVGAAVAAFEQVTSEYLLSGVRRLPPWTQALAPLVGLVVTAVVLRWVAWGASPSTTDEYIKKLPRARCPAR